MCDFFSRQALVRLSFPGPRFPERPSNFLGKKTFKIKTCLIVVHFLAPKLVNFALLTDSFFLSFSK